jgi:adenylylsulfate kinase
MKNCHNKNNLTWYQGKISYEERCRLLNLKGLVLWFTGLSGSGKSTLAVEIEKELVVRGKIAYRLDGDNIRHHLNLGLGFSGQDRDENIRRIAEVANLFKDAGIITLVAVISPFQRMRDFARERIGKESFIEVYVKADVETCMKRDPKGLYAKASSGQISNFTGLSSPYEDPLNPDLVLDTTRFSVKESVAIVMEFLNCYINK